MTNLEKSSLMLVSLILFSCGNKKNNQEIEKGISKIPYQKENIYVKVVTIQKKPFSNDLISNGKLVASQKAEIPFKSQDLIQKIYVKNGDKVAKGALLAELDKESSSISLKRAKRSFEKAVIDLEDNLLGYGYKIIDTINISYNILRNCKSKSGFFNAKQELRKAKRDYKETSIRAPFKGVIANLEAIANNFPSSYDNILCMLIATREMKTSFKLLESELTQVKKGQYITMYPFSNPNNPYEGHIVEINPIIDEDGMVKIGAIIKDSKGELFDGMSVKVLVKNELKNELVVPKSAVLLRQNRKVLFTYKDGEALWNYVETGKENSSEVVILKGIKQGDQVIVSGNLNLAHKTKVKIQIN